MADAPTLFVPPAFVPPAFVPAAFAEMRLPVRLAFGSTGGVERRTDVVTLASGFERRSTPWADGRRRFLIGQGLRKLEDAQALVAFFEARRGRLTGFRFKDFTDFSSAAPDTPAGSEPSPLDQPIGAGDGAATVFALAKSYGDAGGGYVRPVAKPVAGSVRVAVAGIELAPAAFTADAATGRVTLAAAPSAGAAVTAGFQFDTPVRFDADRIDVTLEGFDAARVAAVALIEVRV